MKLFLYMTNTLITGLHITHFSINFYISQVKVRPKVPLINRISESKKEIRKKKERKKAYQEKVIANQISAGKLVDLFSNIQESHRP